MTTCGDAGGAHRLVDRDRARDHHLRSPVDEDVLESAAEVLGHDAGIETAATRWRASSGSSASAVGSVKPAVSGRPSAIARAMQTITAV